jgi:hypothetical protein
MLTSHGMAARPMPNIMPVTPTLASKQGSLMLRPETYPQNGVFPEH